MRVRKKKKRDRTTAADGTAKPTLACVWYGYSQVSLPASAAYDNCCTFLTLQLRYSIIAR